MSTPRLKERYDKEIVPVLTEHFSYGNGHQVPKLEKVVLNMGVGEAIQNSKLVDAAVEDLTRIAGQKAIIRRARKSIANFKLREGMPIGACVTLRNEKMYEFVDRLVNVALPRVKDFRGISRKAFDGRGNYSLGITEHLIFPEIESDKTRGLSVTFVTSAKTNEEAEMLLEKFGFPFKKAN
jgi:large subunit ribosomal protein L5